MSPLGARGASTVNASLMRAPAMERTSTEYVSPASRSPIVTFVAFAPVRTADLLSWMPGAVSPCAMASTCSRSRASRRAARLAAAQLTWTSVLSEERTTDAVPGSGATASAGPAGHPPIPGPPSSPSSAMVRPWRLPSASSSSQDIMRSPPPLAAIAAVAGVSNTYVAVNSLPVVVDARRVAALGGRRERAGQRTDVAPRDVRAGQVRVHDALLELRAAHARPEVALDGQRAPAERRGRVDRRVLHGRVAGQLAVERDRDLVARP